MAGVPGEGVDGVTSAGAANVLYGTAAGPSGAAIESGTRASPASKVSSNPTIEWPASRSRHEASTGFRMRTAPWCSVTGDHFSHSPDFNEYDMHGEPNSDGEQYTIVAAAAGTIMAIDDSNAEPTSSNNYVWIAHSNGEWTKYTHLETGSVTALGLVVGKSVSAGTALGFEGDVGQASGVHLHFEIADPGQPGQPDRRRRIPHRPGLRAADLRRRRQRAV